MKPTTARRSYSERTSLRLWPFVSASLCLHAVLLLGWQPPANLFMTGSDAALSVSLHFIEPAAPKPAASTASGEPRADAGKPERRERKRAAAPQPAPKRAARSAAPAPAQPAPPRPPETDAAVSENAAENVNNTAGTVATEVAPADSAGDALSRKSARAQVRSLLLADLGRYFEYPWLARRHGWQGMVWLSVTVEADGTLERIRVTQSSGYDVLDRSAVETMQRVGQLAAASRWLEGQPLELPLPIVYRLTD